MNINNQYTPYFCANFKSPKLNFSNEDFFIRIKGYGRDEAWAQQMKQTADDAVDMLRNNDDPEDVLKYISTATRVASQKDEDYHKRVNAGILRIERDGWQFRECEIFTPITNQYRAYEERLNDVYHKPLKDPFARKISLTKPSNPYSARLYHGTPQNINEALEHVINLCKKIIPKYVKEDIKPQNLPEVNSDMAEMRWVLAHSTPWIRSSDAISNTFMHAIYKAIGVKTYPIKKGVSLDMEAYCTNLDEYNRLFTDYFDKAPEIVE